MDLWRTATATAKERLALLKHWGGYEAKLLNGDELNFPGFKPIGATWTEVAEFLFATFPELTGGLVLITGKLPDYTELIRVRVVDLYQEFPNGRVTDKVDWEFVELTYATGEFNEPHELFTRLTRGDLSFIRTRATEMPPRDFSRKIPYDRAAFDQTVERLENDIDAYAYKTALVLGQLMYGV